MRQYYITDRKPLGGLDALLRNIRRVAAHVDMIQIREKDLSTRVLLKLVREAVAIAGPKILVNSRLDVALAAGAAGLHLPAGSPAPPVFRRITPPGFLVGVSCHTLAEAQQADQEDADFIVFGPVFHSVGKGRAVGLEALQAVAKAVAVPVFALGGIAQQNKAKCVAAGAVGVAGITTFQKP